MSLLRPDNARSGIHASPPKTIDLSDGTWNGQEIKRIVDPSIMAVDFSSRINLSRLMTRCESEVTQRQALRVSRLKVSRIL